jgi:hypothetical protein
VVEDWISGQAHFDARHDPQPGYPTRVLDRSNRRAGHENIVVIEIGVAVGGADRLDRRDLSEDCDLCDGFVAARGRSFRGVSAR